MGKCSLSTVGLAKKGGVAMMGMNGGGVEDGQLCLGGWGPWCEAGNAGLNTFQFNFGTDVVLELSKQLGQCRKFTESTHKMLYFSFLSRC